MHCICTQQDELVHGRMLTSTDVGAAVLPRSPRSIVPFSQCAGIPWTHATVIITRSHTGDERLIVGTCPTVHVDQQHHVSSYLQDLMVWMCLTVLALQVVENHNRFRLHQHHAGPAHLLSCCTHCHWPTWKDAPSWQGCWHTTPPQKQSTSRSHRRSLPCQTTDLMSN